MTAGELIVLFGLSVNKSTFNEAFKHLALVKAVASEVVGVLHRIGEGLVEMALESAKAGTHIIGTAQALGMSTRAVQEWQYVAKQAGSNIEQFVVGISMFERNLREFAAGRGSKRFLDAMRDVHISVGEARTALAGPDGVNAAIFKVSDAYLRMGNTANRAAINTGLFGARARGMAQDLGQGSAFLRQKILEIHELGGVIDDASLQRLKAFDNSVGKIKAAFNGLAMQVVADLAPKFIALIDKITVWLAYNREMISDILGAAFKVLSFVFTSLFSVIKAFGILIEEVMNGNGGAIILLSLVIALVAGLAVAIITLAMPAIIAMGIALWTAFAPLLPFVLILAAIIAASILIYTHWEEIAEWAHGFWPWLLGIINDVGNALDSFGSSVAAGWHEFWAAVGRGASRALERIVADVLDAVNTIIHVLNYIPFVNIGDVGMPDWAKHNTGEKPSAPGKSSQGSLTGAFAGQQDAPAVPAPKVNFGAASGSTTPGPVASNVSIAPTTVNIYGVKDAQEAQGHIATAIDNQNRHAAAALAGEVA